MTGRNGDLLGECITVSRSFGCWQLHRLSMRRLNVFSEDGIAIRYLLCGLEMLFNLCWSSTFDSRSNWLVKWVLEHLFGDKVLVLSIFIDLKVDGRPTRGSLSRRNGRRSICDTSSIVSIGGNKNALDATYQELLPFYPEAWWPFLLSLLLLLW